MPGTGVVVSEAQANAAKQVKSKVSTVRGVTTSEALASAVENSQS